MESVNRIKEILNGMNKKEGIQFNRSWKLIKEETNKKPKKKRDGKQERNENMVERFQFNSPICDRGPCSAETEEQVLKMHWIEWIDVSVLEQEYGSQEHVQVDLKLGKVEKKRKKNRFH
jgi:hypothetical protein